mmetsp:Transcript_12873/g.22974  ORF Transcript_12873/g.22974 Transcript_12873/m.22974 type:complete len:98 (-) Transcript_12873:15-308(-)
MTELGVQHCFNEASRAQRVGMFAVRRTRPVLKPVFSFLNHCLTFKVFGTTARLQQSPERMEVAVRTKKRRRPHRGVVTGRRLFRRGRILKNKVAWFS